MRTAGGAAAAAFTAPAWLPRVALGRDYRSAQRDVFVMVYLRGAADGLSLCVPYGDAGYYSNRPTLAVARPDSSATVKATDLDGFFGLPPAMLPLRQAYLDGKMLVVHAAGSTDGTRSHFDAQRFMELGKPNDPTVSSGWLGRHLMTVDAMVPGAPLRGVGISTGLQQSLVGGPLTLAIPNPASYDIKGSSTTALERRNRLLDMYNLVPDPLHSSALTATATIDLLKTASINTYTPAAGVTYPTNSFGTALKNSAALIKAQIGVEAIAVDIGGWDTHEAQGVTTGSLANLMSSFANGLSAFYRDVIASGGPSTTLIAMSEFGRRVAENASLGTDHGHGNAIFVMGSCVQGGRVIRNWPGLGAGQLYQNLDLKVTTDYRDIVWEIMSQRLGSPDHDLIFPGHTYAPKGLYVPGCV
jgi:uncharacterized protein (DUF1501 family)